MNRILFSIHFVQQHTEILLTHDNKVRKCRVIISTIKCEWDGSRNYDKTLGLRDVRNTCSALRQMVTVRTRVDGQSRTGQW